MMDNKELAEAIEVAKQSVMDTGFCSGRVSYMCEQHYEALLKEQQERAERNE